MNEDAQQVTAAAAAHKPKPIGNSELALHYAAAKGCVECVQALVLLSAHESARPGQQQQRARPRFSANAPMAHNQVTPVYLAAQEGHLAVLRLLVCQAGGRLEARASDGMSALHAAAQMGALDCLQWMLLDQQLDPNLTDREGATALHYAASRGHVQCLRWMLKHSAALLACDANGLSPLDDAAENGQLDALKLLIYYAHRTHTPFGQPVSHLAPNFSRKVLRKANIKRLLAICLANKQRNQRRRQLMTNYETLPGPIPIPAAAAAAKRDEPGAGKSKLESEAELERVRHPAGVKRRPLATLAPPQQPARTGHARREEARLAAQMQENALRSQLKASPTSLTSFRATTVEAVNAATDMAYGQHSMQYQPARPQPASGQQQQQRRRKSAGLSCQPPSVPQSKLSTFNSSTQTLGARNPPRAAAAHQPSEHQYSLPQELANEPASDIPTPANLKLLYDIPRPSLIGREERRDESRLQDSDSSGQQPSSIMHACKERPADGPVIDLSRHIPIRQSCRSVNRKTHVDRLQQEKQSSDLAAPDQPEQVNGKQDTNNNTSGCGQRFVEKARPPDEENSLDAAKKYSSHSYGSMKSLSDARLFDRRRGTTQPGSVTVASGGASSASGSESNINNQDSHSQIQSMFDMSHLDLTASESSLCEPANEQQSKDSRQQLPEMDEDVRMRSIVELGERQQTLALVSMRSVSSRDLRLSCSSANRDNQTQRDAPAASHGHGQQQQQAQSDTLRLLRRRSIIGTLVNRISAARKRSGGGGPSSVAAGDDEPRATSLKASDDEPCKSSSSTLSSHGRRRHRSSRANSSCGEPIAVAANSDCLAGSSSPPTAAPSVRPPANNNGPQSAPAVAPPPPPPPPPPSALLLNTCPLLTFKSTGPASVSQIRSQRLALQQQRRSSLPTPATSLAAGNLELATSDCHKLTASNNQSSMQSSDSDSGQSGCSSTEGYASTKISLLSASEPSASSHAGAEYADSGCNSISLTHLVNQSPSTSITQPTPTEPSATSPAQVGSPPAATGNKLARQQQQQEQDGDKSTERASFQPPRFLRPPEDGANIRPSEYLKQLSSHRSGPFAGPLVALAGRPTNGNVKQQIRSFNAVPKLPVEKLLLVGGGGGGGCREATAPTERRSCQAAEAGAALSEVAPGAGEPPIRPQAPAPEEQSRPARPCLYASASQKTNGNEQIVKVAGDVVTNELSAASLSAKQTPSSSTSTTTTTTAAAELAAATTTTNLVKKRLQVFESNFKGLESDGNKAARQSHTGPATSTKLPTPADGPGAAGAPAVIRTMQRKAAHNKDELIAMNHQTIKTLPAPTGRRMPSEASAAKYAELDAAVAVPAAGAVAVAVAGDASIATTTAAAADVEPAASSCEPLTGASAARERLAAEELGEV